MSQDSLHHSSPKWQRAACFALFICWLVAICTFGVPRAMEHVFTVDEFHTAYNTHLLNADNPERFVESFQLYNVLLATLTRQFSDSVSIYLLLRLVFFAFFIIHLLLIAWAQPYFTSWPGRLGVLVGASLVWPLWASVTELRHDSVVVLMQPILYWATQRLVRKRRIERGPLILAGLACAWMQLNPPKAAVYWVPWLAAAVVFLPIRLSDQGWFRSRVRLAGWIVIGLSAGVTAAAAILAAKGLLFYYVENVVKAFQFYGDAGRFSAKNTVDYLLNTEPLLLVLTSLAILLRGFDSLATRKLPPPESLVTFGFVAWSFLTLSINPNPYLYNAMHFNTFAIFAAADGVKRLWDEPVPMRRSITFIVVSCLAAWQLLPDPPRCDARLFVGQIFLFGVTVSFLLHRRVVPTLVFWLGVVLAFLSIQTFRMLFTLIPFVVLLLLLIHVLLGPSQQTIKDRAYRAFVTGCISGIVLFAIFNLAYIIYIGLTYSAWPQTALDWVPLPDDRPQLVNSATIDIVFVPLLLTIALKTLYQSGHFQSQRVALSLAFVLWGIAVWWLGYSSLGLTSVNVFAFALLAVNEVGVQSSASRLPSRAFDIALMLCVAVGLTWRGASADVFSNRAQVSYLNAIEQLTDPRSDSIVDGMGFVVTRRPPTKYWYLSRVHFRAYLSGKRTFFDELLENDPSPVVLSNYRWTWLSGKVHRLLEQRYVEIAPQLYVLGGKISGASGTFEIFRSGRYRIEPANKQPLKDLTIDGHSVPPEKPIVLLQKGQHQFSSKPNESWTVFWIGPHLDNLPAIISGSGDGSSIMPIPH